MVDTNNFAQASLYAADNDIEVVEGASGALFNSRFGRKAFEHAYREGVFFAIVSSDLNTADHNIPTLYDEAMQVQGTVADVQGLGEETRHQDFVDFFADLGMPLGTNLPIQTWFRNSGTTQYGGHAHIVMPAVTGSAATGQASGAAGLIKSFARQEGMELAPNEIKQLITGDGVRRGPARHRRSGRSRPGSPRLGPALRLRPARPRASRWSGSTRGRSHRSR